MPITIIFTKPDGSVDQTETHDFGDTPEKQNNNIDRLTDWARHTYFNDDGTIPGQNAGRSRLAKHTVQAWRDEMRRYEAKQDIAALPPPEDIDI